MNSIIKIYKYLTQTMDAPTNFGAYHIACIVAVILLSLICAALLRNKSDRAINKFTVSLWALLVVLEVYKQLIYGFDLVGASLNWDYAWYAFPFQFCSSPLYILPIIAFTKKEKVRDACIAYMMSFSFFAGLAVFCYPNDVFTSTIGINLQTMIHHGSQILFGIVFAARYREKMNMKFFLRGVSVFVVMSAVAMILNHYVYQIFLTVGIDETFNMFYISPYFDCTLPVLSVVYDKVSYPVFLVIYLLGFVVAARIAFCILGKITSVEEKSSYEIEKNAMYAK